QKTAYEIFTRLEFRRVLFRPHGPIVQTAFRWPAEGDEGRTSLVVEELGGRRVGIEKNTGPWSLFRLLDLMEVDYHSGRDVLMLRSEERRVGKECRAEWSACR